MQKFWLVRYHLIATSCGGHNVEIRRHTKPEVHNAARGLAIHDTCTENSVKSDHVVFDICKGQTDRQADILITIGLCVPLLGRRKREITSNKKICSISKLLWKYLSSVLCLLEFLVDQLHWDPPVSRRRHVLHQSRTVGGRRLEHHLKRHTTALLCRIQFYTHTFQHPQPDTAMGWINPWVGWAGSKILIITVGSVGRFGLLRSTQIQWVVTVKCFIVNMV